jgi:hypothetical protein
LGSGWPALLGVAVAGAGGPAASAAGELRTAQIGGTTVLISAKGFPLKPRAVRQIIKMMPNGPWHSGPGQLRAGRAFLVMASL